MTKLTEAMRETLLMLEPGYEVESITLARDLGIRAMATGSFAGLFARAYRAGYATRRVTRDAYFYTITPLGRTSLDSAKERET